MLVVKNNEHSTNYQDGIGVQPLQSNDPVILVMDPSKTNFAMIVGTPDGRILDVVEFSGNNRTRGPIVDTTVYCHQIRTYLSQYLSQVNLYIVAIEAAITERGEKQNHVTNMTLTEIRANVLSFFYDTYGIKPIQINNWSWKHSELPEGFRSPFQKMSKKALAYMEPNHPLLNYFHEDACDAYFMYKYILKTMCGGYTLTCNCSEPPSKEFKYIIVIDDYEDMPSREVTYNPHFSVEDNVTFYANRLPYGFYMSVPIEDLSMEEIYGHAHEIPISISLHKTVQVVVC